jgi:hypothetical protein
VGGAPPLPLDFAPQGAKKPVFFGFFEPSRILLGDRNPGSTDPWMEASQKPIPTRNWALGPVERHPREGA